MFAKSDLDEIEEISTEKVPPDLAGAESDFQPKRPEVSMGELDRVKDRRKDATGHGLKSKTGPSEHIEPK